MVIEAMDPVARGLTIHAADPGRIGAAHAVQNRRQRQKPAALLAVFARLGKLAQARLAASATVNSPCGVQRLIPWANLLSPKPIRDRNKLE